MEIQRSRPGVRIEQLTFESPLRINIESLRNRYSRGKKIDDRPLSDVSRDVLTDSSGRFEKDTERGIITDLKTNLQWLVGPDIKTNFHDAQEWVLSLGSAWRLPKVAELQELYSSGIRVNNWGLFKNNGKFVWSCTSNQKKDAALYVFFKDGKVYQIYRSTGSSRGRAFAVRSTK